MKEKRGIAAQVLSSIAHDLRSPLNAVLGFSKIMLKGLDGPLTDMQMDDLKAIQSNGQLMLDMVNAIIDLGKLEAGTLEPGQAEVYLTPVVEQVVAQAQTQLKEMPIQVNVNTGDPLISIRAERGHIQQLLLDMLLVVAHLIQSGTVNLNVESDRHTVSVTVQGKAEQGLSPDAPVVWEAYSSGGASREQRVDLNSLRLLTGERRVWLYRGEFWIEQPAGDTVSLGFKLPTTRFPGETTGATNV